VVYREDENQAGEVIPEEYDMIELGTRIYASINLIFLSLK
jgi:hypothetical protein